MNWYIIKKKTFLLLVISLALPLAVLSQTDTLPKATSASPISDTPAEAVHSLYTGIGAGSNMIYLGTSISNNRPFYSASVTYGYRNGFFASASATHLTETTPYIAFYNLALNYTHAFNSWFDISADIAGYKTSAALHDSLFADFAYMNLTTGFDWQLIYTRISFSGVLSEQNGFYLQISNSRYFETPSFLKGKALVSFNPDIDVLLGNMISADSVTGSKRYGNGAPFIHASKKPSSSTETYSENFGLMDLQFSLPVTFSYGNFSLEAEASYLLPVYTDPYYPEQKGFTFYLNIFFKIF